MYTENCIFCNNPAEYWSGHVLYGSRRVMVTAGFCNTHKYKIDEQMSVCFGVHKPEYGLIENLLPKKYTVFTKQDFNSLVANSKHKIGHFAVEQQMEGNQIIIRIFERKYKEAGIELLKELRPYAPAINTLKLRYCETNLYSI
jgi:hypothetical protein